MRIDPDNLMKTSNIKSDKMSHADDFMKINGLSEMPMSL
jgi:hypothetical protein